MIIQHKISSQVVSWVKSNKRLLEAHEGIENLYYPESLQELQDLILNLRVNNESFDLIGYSSNTLFLPSYSTKHLICTKHVNKWEETDDYIICDCGVSVSQLARFAVEKGYVGFEGLTDLPGTIAAAVYGNCGCRGCSVNELVKSFTLMNNKDEIKEYSIKDITPTYRSTALKRGEIQGTILQVILNKIQDDPEKLKKIAEYNHATRLVQQPSAANNLGTTINGGSDITIYGKCIMVLNRLIKIIPSYKDSRKSFPLVLKIIGKGKFSPYVYYWNRYMFLDEKSHKLFNEYYSFTKQLYKDARLEIVIRK